MSCSARSTVAHGWEPFTTKSLIFNVGPEYLVATRRSASPATVALMSVPPVIPTSRNGFFSSLFDMSFSRLVTTRAVKPLYILLIVLVAIGLVASIVSSIIAGSIAGVLIAVVGGTIAALLTIIYGRIVLEVLLAIFRLLETNREIAYLQRQQLEQLQRDPAAGNASQQYPPAS